MTLIKVTSEDLGGALRPGRIWFGQHPGPTGSNGRRGHERRRRRLAGRRVLAVQHPVGRVAAVGGRPQGRARRASPGRSATAQRILTISRPRIRSAPRWGEAESRGTRSAGVGQRSLSKAERTGADHVAASRPSRGCGASRKRHEQRAVEVEVGLQEQPIARGAHARAPVTQCAKPVGATGGDHVHPAVVGVIDRCPLSARPWSSTASASSTNRSTASTPAFTVATSSVN